MGKVMRSLVVDGGYAIIEHAVCLNGDSPSLSAFQEMRSGEWREDPELGEIPDEAQISQHDKFLVGIEYFAETGYPNNAYCTVNNLDDGIWEFKRAKLRVSFFDTDGQGGFTPKLRIRDIREASDTGDFWWLPEFDQNIRLGHAFGKRTQLTEPQDIAETIRVRKEDVSHDY